MTRLPRIHVEFVKLAISLLYGLSVFLSVLSMRVCFFAPFFHALAAIPAGLTNMAGWMASFFLVECSEFERRSAIEALLIKEKEARFAVRVRLLTSLRGYILTNQGEACQNNCQSGGCYDASARCHLVTTQQFVRLLRLI